MFACLCVCAFVRTRVCGGGGGSEVCVVCGTCSHDATDKLLR